MIPIILEFEKKEKKNPKSTGILPYFCYVMPCVSQVLGIHHQQIRCAERLSLKVLPRRLPCGMTLEGFTGSAFWNQINRIYRVRKPFSNSSLFWNMYRNHCADFHHCFSQFSSGIILNDARPNFWAPALSHAGPTWSLIHAGPTWSLRCPAKPIYTEQCDQNQQKKKNIINRSQSRTISIPYLP